MQRASLIIAAALLGLTCHALAQSGGDRLGLPSIRPSVAPKPGLQPLDTGSKGGLLYVPKSYQPGEPLPLLLLLHPSGGDSSYWFGSYARRAEAAHILIVAPDCRHKTWGAGPRDYGNDAAVINRALAVAASRCTIDRKHLAIGGFSDGASYALSLGIANGDLFTNVIAFSPGYFIGKPQRGKPAFFISHGVIDEVLPIDDCSRRFVNSFRQAGYTVDYREFYGKHEVPESTSDQAMAWLQTRFHIATRP